MGAPTRPGPRAGVGGGPGWRGGEGGRGVVGIPLVENKKASWFLGFLVSEFLGFLVSEIQKIFKVVKRYLVHITKFPFHAF